MGWSNALEQCSIGTAAISRVKNAKKNPASHVQSRRSRNRGKIRRHEKRFGPRPALIQAFLEISSLLAAMRPIRKKHDYCREQPFACLACHESFATPSPHTPPSRKMSPSPDPTAATGKPRVTVVNGINLNWLCTSKAGLRRKLWKLEPGLGGGKPSRSPDDVDLALRRGIA